MTPDSNPYLAPTAVLLDEHAPADVATAPFYVVASGKFLLLMISTFGLYSLYWFWRNWTQLNRRGGDFWPVPRAIFAIFFTHSLLRHVDAELQARGLRHEWSHAALATVFVFATIASRVLDRLSRHTESVLPDVVSLLMLAPIAYVLHRAQQAINLACGDPAGRGNASITLANIIWVVLGSMVWLLVLAGWVLIVLGIE